VESLSSSDVNKATGYKARAMQSKTAGCKDEAKDLGFQAQVKAKNSGFKAKA